MKQGTFSLGFFFFCFTILFCFGQKIEVADNLSGLFNDLHNESFSTAIIVSPFITAWDIFQVFTEKGKKVFVITQRKNIKDYTEYIKDKKRVILYTTNLHSKMFLMLNKNNSMKGYIGSANFTRNSADNNELILIISNPEEIPGFIEFIKELFKRSLLHESVWQGERPLPKIPLKGLASSRLTRMGEPVEIELVSYFDFHTEPDYDLILWIANRIKTEENRNYLISSMTFNYPAFLSKIKKAVKKGSTFKILIDKRSLLENPRKQYALIDLIRFSRNYSQNIAIHWISGGGGTEISTHHAKLFVRLPRGTTGKDGISIVSTANFTEVGGNTCNSALVLPHDRTDSSTITELNSKFDNWWKESEEIPLEELESRIRAKRLCRSHTEPVIGHVVEQVPVPTKSLSEPMTGNIESERDSFTRRKKRQFEAN